MKIVNVLNVISKDGGKSGRCIKLVWGLEALGHEQLVIAINAAEYDVHPDFSAAKNVRFEVADRKRIGYIKTIHRVFRLLNEFKPDVVVVWGTGPASVITSLFALKHRYFKFIGAYIADCLYPRTDLLSKCIHCYSIRRYDYFVGNSQAALDSYKIPKQKQQLIYNGYVPRDVPFRSKEEICREIGLDVKYIISMIAVMRKEKDYETFINCAEEVCKERNNVAFLCIGNGALEEELRQKVTNMHQNRIQVLGFRHDVDNYFKASYLTVTCNSIMKNGAVTESLSNSIVESLAVGTPVLATNCGGTPEIIQDNVNGFLLLPYDVQQLKTYILYLLDNPDERERMSITAVDTVRTKFGIDRMVHEFEALFKK